MYVTALLPGMAASPHDASGVSLTFGSSGPLKIHPQSGNFPHIQFGVRVGPTNTSSARCGKGFAGEGATHPDMLTRTERDVRCCGRPMPYYSARSNSVPSRWPGGRPEGCDRCEEP